MKTYQKSQGEFPTSTKEFPALQGCKLQPGKPPLDCFSFYFDDEILNMLVIY